MLIYTKGRELIEKDLAEQEKAEAGENKAHEIKTEPKQQKKKFRRFFRKM
ncbi:hypothetical protein HUG15_00675 [Salicibibacter cibarius]|uniref:Uncharacterized protein n=1 Tax=Salicibibacter cibarius TaxID=2743000 RepID=A0A7T6Z091_9BACI|nr:hypothetical protein [Salicibibacter cibarius]QQK74277.1 hypothetical protein HUG15_00675 [Salicibibacter cibarius]